MKRPKVIITKTKKWTFKRIMKGLQAYLLMKKKKSRKSKPSPSKKKSSKI